METLGFKSPKQLTTARKKAMDAGWLHYERDGTRAVGNYWTLVPERVAKFDDTPIEESPPILSAGGTSCGTNSGTNSGKPSYPDPDPSTSSPDGDVPSKTNPRKRHMYSVEFEAWWIHYPLKVAKRKAFTAYKHAAKEVGTDKLQEAVIAFSNSDIAKGDRKYIPHPATWLNQGRYEDAPTVWNNGRTDGNGSSGMSAYGPLERPTR
jgi:hypothetical protein